MVSLRDVIMVYNRVKARNTMYKWQYDHFKRLIIEMSQVLSEDERRVVYRELGLVDEHGL